MCVMRARLAFYGGNCFSVRFRTVNDIKRGGHLASYIAMPIICLLLQFYYYYSFVWGFEEWNSLMISDTDTLVFISHDSRYRSKALCALMRHRFALVTP